MKKGIFIILFIIGLGIFSYPVVSNMVETKVHRSVVMEYNQTVEEMDEGKITAEKKKIEDHNEGLAQSDLNFVDPFAEDRTGEKEGTTSYYDALNIGPSIGSIEIPKINVQLPIFHGTSDDVLSRGAGHLENSSLPSNNLGTHSVITAHRGLPSSKLFRDLDELKIGDQFYVQILDEVIAYEIDRIDIVLPHETAWLSMEEDQNKMTLLTCEPYMINSHRMLVTGYQVPYVLDQLDVAEEYEYENVQVPYYVIGSIIALLFIIYFLRRKKKQGEM